LRYVIENPIARRWQIPEFLTVVGYRLHVHEIRLHLEWPLHGSPVDDGTGVTRRDASVAHLAAGQELHVTIIPNEVIVRSAIDTWGPGAEREPG